jgi:AsmA family protein
MGKTPGIHTARPMRKRQQAGFLRQALLLLLGLFALVLVAAVVVSLLRIPLDLSRYKPLVESSLASALGREVSINGGVVVTTSLWPYFEIEGLHIANPEGLDAGSLATMDLARVSVGLLPLLQRKLQIGEFRVSGLALDLVRASDGSVNWVLQGAAPATESQPDSGQDQGTTTLASDSLSLDELTLEDIRVSFRDGDAQPLEFVMEQALGSAPVGEPMNLSIQGTLLEEAFSLGVKADSLGDFLAMTRTRLGLQFDIAGTQLAFSGLSEALGGGRAIEFKMSVEAANLSSLNGLTGLDLPPIQDYRLAADLRAEPGQIKLTALEASVKDSKLVGSMLIDRSGKRPVATLDLSAPRIQLQDFDTGGWAAEAPAAEAESQPQTDAADPDQDPEAAATYDKLLSPEALARADARLTVRVDEVRSGKDMLGSGELLLELQDGRITLDPLQLQLPQASLLVKASLKPGTQVSDASLRVLLENFDFGALTRLSNPDSEVGGTLSIDIDVTASASNTSNILSGANGYLDISGQPENFRSGLVDLWAVNLLSAVVSSSAKDEEVSQINCMIGRFRLVDGVMSAENLAADTSKIRMCGKGEISFDDRRFNLVVRPKPKRPEYFNLATPLAVRGSFDDFSIGMNAGVLSLGKTAVNFTISPITTPIKRVFRDDLPEDGADICALPIGPREQELEPLPGC